MHLIPYRLGGRWPEGKKRKRQKLEAGSMMGRFLYDMADQDQ